MATAETRMPEYPTNTLLPRRIRGKEVRAPTAHERPEFRQTPRPPPTWLRNSQQSMGPSAEGPLESGVRPF